MWKKIKKFFRETFRFIGALLALARGIVVLGMVCVAAFTAYMIYTVGTVTVNQYNESLEWEKTAYEGKLSEIEPALVANVVDTKTVDAAASWEALEKYVKALDGKGIPDRTEAESLLSDAVSWQEKYGLASDTIDRLGLYMELEDEIPKAYETLDTTRLRELSITLNDLELQEKTRAGQGYIERLKGVSADFDEVQAMMEETVWQIGTMEDGVWTIPYTYTREDLSETMERMKAMEKFPAISDTSKVLSDITTALNQNKNARDRFEYLEFAKSIEGLSRSQYVPLTTMYTYGQAMEKGFTVNAEELPGLAIQMRSPITGIWYNGEQLQSSQCVKLGLPLRIEIDEIYEPLITEEQVQEESIGEEQVWEEQAWEEQAWEEPVYKEQNWESEDDYYE